MEDVTAIRQHMLNSISRNCLVISSIRHLIQYVLNFSIRK